METHVIQADWPSHAETLRDIRGKVFVEEQGVPQDLEWDGQDDTAHHFLAINAAGQRLGCCRLLPSGQIGRLAVLPDQRRKGIGRQLLDAAIDQAKTLGLSRVFLHAQVDALEFYREAGFLPEGDEFLEAGITHRSMTLPLPIPFATDPDLPRPEIRPQQAAPQADAGELTQHVGESACIEALKTSLSWPQRIVRIYSQELDHLLFDRPDVADLLSAFARRAGPTKLHVLVHSSSAIVSRGHRLLELARRLDSKVEIRKVPAELAEDNHACVLSDDEGFFLLPDHRDYQALANRYDPVQTRRLAERFDYLWEHSAADPELRVLRI